MDISEYSYSFFRRAVLRLSLFFSQKGYGFVSLVTTIHKWAGAIAKNVSCCVFINGIRFEIISTPRFIFSGFGRMGAGGNGGNRRGGAWWRGGGGGGIGRRVHHLGRT